MEKRGSRNASASPREGDRVPAVIVDQGEIVRIDLLALYQKSLLGGLGGLFGWLLMTLLVHVSTETVVRLYVKDMITGALIGVALGAAVGAWDGLFRDRTSRRLIVGTGVGAAIGLVGGMLGLVVGEVIFRLAGGGLFLRAIGWGVFGALIGTNEGISKRMPQKAMFGAYGGLLGGLIGGSTYESLAGLFQFVGLGRSFAIAAGGAVGLVLLGLFIGLLVGLVEDILRVAWLQFTSGRFEGQTRTLDPKKGVTTVGRSELSDICILGDQLVVPDHAQIVSSEGGFVLQAVDGEVLVSTGGPFTAHRRHRLSPGDLIQIGSSRARFHSGETAK